MRTQPTEISEEQSAELATVRRRLRQQSVVLDRLTLIAKCYFDHQSGMSSDSIIHSLKLLSRGLRASSAFISVESGSKDGFTQYAATRRYSSLPLDLYDCIWNDASVRQELEQLTPFISLTAHSSAICQKCNLSNLLLVPLHHDDAFGGYIGVVNYSRSHTSEQDVVRYVKLAGELIHHSLLLNRSEQERKSHEALFRKVIDINPNFIFAKDREGRFILVNEAVAEVYGARVEQILGKTDADFNTDAKECEQFLKDDLEVMETLREKFVPEERITDTSGKVRYLQTVKRPILDDEGVARAVLGVSADITDRKHAEAEREKLMLKMQQTQRLESLGVLAGGIAHDFNNLLMGIVGHCELAESLANDPRWVVDKLSQIRLAAQRATELTNQLLAYSGKGHFLVQEANLSDLVREICSLLEVVVSKKARVQLELATRLPIVEVDVAQIRQVFMNLLTNASDALCDQSGRIVIRTEQVEVTANTAYSVSSGQLRFKEDLNDGTYVLLQVIDSGIGMDACTLERIFDPFFTTKFTGRGLGLAAVHGIIRGHKGAIRVDSKPQAGTCFHVLLPSKSGFPRRSGSIKEYATATIIPDSIHVLLVDDEHISRTVVEHMLHFLGHRVSIARDGREALRIFGERRGEFGLVLLDLTMPEMDGYETWHELIELDSTVPVLLMSGYCETDVRRRFNESTSLLAGNSGLNMPSVAFIQKPFGQLQLSKKLRELGIDCRQPQRSQTVANDLIAEGGQKAVSIDTYAGPAYPPSSPNR